MRMLKNTVTGMLYTYHEGLAEAENIEVVQVDHVTAQAPPQAPPPVLLTESPGVFHVLPDSDPMQPVQNPAAASLFDNAPVGDQWPLPGPAEPDPDVPPTVKSLDEMTRDELIAVAEIEERRRGDNRNLSRMKKEDLKAYIVAGDA